MPERAGREHGTAPDLPRMTGLALSQEAVDAMLTLVASLASRAIPGVDGVGVSLVRDERLVTAACSDEVVRELDSAQYDTGEGPSVAALRDGRPIRFESASPDLRWPRFEPAFSRKGFASVLSLPLLTAGRPVGVLNLYSRAAEAPGAAPEQLAGAFAREVATILASSRPHAGVEELPDQFQDAARSRELIAQAQGILMERKGFAPDEAFDWLRRHSQHSDTRLRAVAQEVVDSSHYPTDLAEAFSAIARRLFDADTVEGTLKQIVNLAVETIDGCDYAGVSLVLGLSITTPVFSDEIVAAADAVQYETDEGPCLDALRLQATFEAGDLAHDARWPRFGPRVAEMGVAGLLSYHLFAHERTLGALNLYSRTARAFDDTAHRTGAIFAAHAAIALSAAQTHEGALEESAGMKSALESRDIIGQAKGILMERESITAGEAFDVLRRASQHINVKLREVARRVTETGESPDPGASPHDQ
jgi:AmiR/NasT family two-component response regulator